MISLASGGTKGTVTLSLVRSSLQTELSRNARDAMAKNLAVSAAYKFCRTDSLLRVKFNDVADHAIVSRVS